MKLNVLPLLLLFACGAVPVRKDPKIIERTADASYERKDFAACAEQYASLADAVEKPEAKADAYYGAACCSARAQQTEAAFGWLHRAVGSGYSRFVHIIHDTDLDGLHTAPQWQPIVAAVEHAYARDIKQPELRRQLLERESKDQELRNAWLVNQDDTARAEAVVAMDMGNTAWLENVVSKHGWPTKSLVAQDGASAAWLLVQHADQNPAFQARCLALMEPLVASGEVEAQNVAYLYDRVAVAAKRPQRYGTQFMNATEPFPIEDAANVDARRKAVGLDSMAEYAKQIAAAPH